MKVDVLGYFQVLGEITALNPPSALQASEHKMRAPFWAQSPIGVALVAKRSNKCGYAMPAWPADGMRKTPKTCSIGL